MELVIESLDAMNAADTMPSNPRFAADAPDLDCCFSCVPDGDLEALLSSFAGHSPAMTKVGLSIAGSDQRYEAHPLMSPNRILGEKA